MSASPSTWSRLVADANPAALLVAIRGRMGPRLRTLGEADDVLQDVLLYAWRQRHSFEWRGLGSFRRWLLSIADHRMCDLADQNRTQKRGGGRERRAADLTTNLGADVYAGPAAATTPSRAASDREQAEQLEACLADVPEDCRDVVRLRLFEELELSDIASRLAIGGEAVRYRFRRGLDCYQRAIRRRRAFGNDVDSSES